VAEAGISIDEFKRRASHYAQSARGGRVEGLLLMACTRPHIAVAVSQLDQHPLLLACRNGEVDLRTGELHHADPDHLITKGVAIDYIPGARSDLWEAFLATTFDSDVDLICYVQRLIGYACTGIVAEHIAPVPYGTGANGKSTLIGVVQDMLGALALTAPEGLFTLAANHHPHPERMAALRGRRLVVCYELENKATLAEGLVKTLTGGDRLSAREMYGRRFDFAPTHKVILITNHKPRVTGTDEAIWRRLKLVPFENTVAASDQDPDLRKKLVGDHGQAVLAWLVEGAVAWALSGLGEAKKVTDATAIYRAEQDIFSAFLGECTEAEPKARTPVGDLWTAWQQWSEKAGERPGRKQDFSVALEAHGVVLEAYQGARFVRNLISREVSWGLAPQLSPRVHIGNFTDETSRDLTKPSGPAAETALGVFPGAKKTTKPLEA
jgi:putative DNA primase/helicase